MGFDYQKLNIRTPAGDWLCPSCGFPGAFDGASFDVDGPVVGTGICPCCLYEPGFDDIAAASGTHPPEPIDALRAYSVRWFEGGRVWRGRSSAIPAGWSDSEQTKVWEQLCKPILK